MAPFHTLRHEARALSARLLAGIGVFLAIAALLFAVGPAEAKNDDQREPGGNAWGHEQHTTEADEGDDGESRGWGRGGGGGKWDPPDPAPPPAPPANPTPTPAPEPAPAPSDGTDDGDDDDGGRPDGDDDAAPTGAGGKGNTADPDPAPTGNTPPASQPDGSSTPGSTPIVEPGSSSPPAAERLASETRSSSARRNRIRFQRGAGNNTVVATPDAGGDAGGAGEAETVFEPAPAAGAGAFEQVGRAEGGGDGSANPTDRRGRNADDERSQPTTIIRTIPELVREVPAALKFALAATAVLSLLLGLGYLMTTMRARSLGRQRRELLQEVGLLQSALLPPVPDHVGDLRTSVAYRPADGPGAGGDFYDVLPLPGGRVGFILGDVSGHGRGALARTAFMRYPLRAYLDAGLEPRVALQVAGRVIDENLGGDFATVLLAVHDPETGSLTYASAGHPAPLVVGPQPHEPVTAGSSPPIGVGVRTGLRQTTVPLVPGSVAAMFTDGLLEARTDGGGLLGRDRLEELLEELGDDATARGLVESVNKVARVMSDDIAAVVIQPTNAATAGLFRTEQLELTARELDSRIAERFLEACGVSDQEVQTAIYDARMIADRFGGVILHVVFGNRLRVEVLPRNVESIEAASRRAAAAR